MMKILTQIFGTSNERYLKNIYPMVKVINDLEPRFKAMSDEELKEQTNLFKQRISSGESLDSLMPEAFAVCREASFRVLGMRHFDVQLIGGMILHKGSIAEMRTGEGKTLVATLPVYLNALSGKGVHVVTVNDYLAKRDSEWMGRLYQWLGLTVGVIVHDLTDYERKMAYGSDITYGTNNEFGFDYLRDNMKYTLEDMVQRDLNFAIVDECDSILIDEARTPLIISGPSELSTDKYYIINDVVPKLKKDLHFTMEEKSKTASLTDEGNTEVEKLLNIENLYDPQNLEMLHHIHQGLKAYYLYQIDVDYMVKDGEIIIVDEFTGRLMPGRRWSDGLHQAIEAKEGVKVKSENQTLASITFQNYFRLYNKMAGMTGTAETEAAEFKKIYSLDVVVTPTNRNIQRKDLDDVVYKNEKAKFKAIAQDILERYQHGQPILVGTISIEKSESLSHFLKREGVTHQVLNAKHHEREAEIVAQAGRLKSVTIATNMAGRGTDIVLGGNPEMLAKSQFIEPEGPEFEQALAKWKSVCEDEKRKVIEAGGLYIVGTERHESRRIDNQLRGRSGRQGDPGESRFYLSLEDNLMRIFNGEMISRVMERLNVPEDEPITAKMVTRSIESAQRKVEGHHFDTRKHLLEYDDVMNKQRIIIYGLRKRLMTQDNLEQDYLEILSDVLSLILDQALGAQSKLDLDQMHALHVILQGQFGVLLNYDNNESYSETVVVDMTKEAVKLAYDEQLKRLSGHVNHIQKILWLQSIDHHWKEHLHFVDRLREGIGLRGYAQKDPVVEYKKEAFAAFERLLETIKKDVIEKFMRVQLVEPESVKIQFEALRLQNLGKLNYKGAEQSAEPIGNMNSLGSSSADLSGPSGRLSAEARGAQHDKEGLPSLGEGKMRVSATSSRGESGQGSASKLNRQQRRQNKR